MSRSSRWLTSSKDTGGSGSALTAAPLVTFVRRPDGLRRLEISLDLVALEATDDTSFLLDERYRAMLADDEAGLADALRALSGHVEGDHASAHRVRDLLRSLGG